LADYVNQLIDTTDHFFTDTPSYDAIFMEVQGTILELEEIDEATHVTAADGRKLLVISWRLLATAAFCRYAAQSSVLA